MGKRIERIKRGAKETGRVFSRGFRSGSERGYRTRGVRHGIGRGIASGGISAMMANPYLALIMIVVGLSLLFIWFSEFIQVLFTSYMLWGLCLIITGLLRPRVGSTWLFALLVGAILWFSESVMPLLGAISDNTICQFPIIGPIVCGLWYGPQLLWGAVKFLGMYAIAAYIIIYLLAFIDHYLERRWHR